ncbi:hypothetical protein [Enterobacter sp. SA187]|uniref:hypothetical protein n=1 Tax=Enterobacter sp. SA187 TaxID=1914861 RepID=UPI000A985D9A|nr:hypothetical protein [Enterobacter sp. SA187]
MMQAIIFENQGAAGVLFPAACGLSVLDIGRKDVPQGVSFWIVNAEDLPGAALEAWELNIKKMGAPAGTGGTYIAAEGEIDDNGK